MNSVDVFGIEVKSFVGDDGDECLVPRLIGSSATVEAKKRPSASLDELFVAAPIEVLSVRDRLAEWAQRSGLLESNAAQCYQIKDRRGTIARVYPGWKTIELGFGTFGTTRPDLVDNWIARLQEIAGEKKLTRVNPSMACTAALTYWGRLEEVLNELAAARAELDDAN